MSKKGIVNAYDRIRYDRKKAVEDPIGCLTVLNQRKCNYCFFAKFIREQIKMIFLSLSSHEQHTLSFYEN